MTHSRRRTGVAIVLVAIAALAFASTLLLSDSSSHSAAAARKASAWTPLAALPQRMTTNVDGASMASAAGRLYVAVVDYGAANGAPSTVRLYAKAGDGWTGALGGRDLKTDRGATVNLLGGARPCVATTMQRRATVTCLIGDRWSQLGPPLFPTSQSSGYNTSFQDGRGIVVVRTHTQNAHIEGAGVRGRPVNEIFRFDGHRWRRSPAGIVGAAVPGGTQRPFGFTLGGRTCLTYDSLGADLSVAPPLDTSCESGSKWKTLGPPLTLNDVPPALMLQPPRGRPFVSTDGAVVADQTRYLGAGLRQGASADWLVYQATPNGWRLTDLGGTDPAWSEQGSLFSIDGTPWAIRFDQRPSTGFLATRLTVRRLKPDGSAEQVGRPLASNTRFYGPLYYGLTTIGSNVFAMATVPIPHTRRNEVRVLQLRR